MPSVRKLKYLLVTVDRFPKWVEACPCVWEKADLVVKVLAKEIISRYGILLNIDSDQGTAFTFKITQKLCQYLGIT